MAHRLSKGDWKPQRHLNLISLALARAAYEGGKRLIITLPPRHGKSELISHWFPVWFLNRFPRKQVMLASYSENFATDWGRKVRNSIERHRDDLSVRLAPDSTAASNWKTTKEGGMLAAGVEGGQTGRGADIFIIDDPIKNLKEAYSETTRQGIWDWYQSTSYTRLEPNASIVIIMTRWHEDDLVGRLMREQDRGADQWQSINIPAIAEEDDLIGRAPGEALWPARYNVEHLARIKKAVGPMVWSALFRQQPTWAGYNLFPETAWKVYDFPPPTSSFRSIIQSWDLSFKDLKTSSYVVGQVWGFRKAQAYLLHQVRGQMNFNQAVKAMRDVHAAWPTATPILVEDKANGPAIMSHLENEIRGLLPIEPKGSKEARAAAVQPFVMAGNIWIPNPDRLPWVREFVIETRQFPRGKNDDQVDAFSQAIAHHWLTATTLDDTLDLGLRDLTQESGWIL